MAAFDWELRPETSQSLSAAEISEKWNLPLWVSKILLLRSEKWPEFSLESCEKFLKPSLKHLPNPFLMKDMDKAADRVADAVLKKETIAVYGDYDVDGTVGAALLRKFFRFLQIEPIVYQPDRAKEGYGLNEKAIQNLATKKIDLLICVDCGISNYQEVEVAKSLGMDVVICDHHEVPEPMPAATAVLDHKRKDHGPEIQNLCGAGVAFYLTLAVRSKLRELNYFQEGNEEPDLKKLLDLVALATVADMVPLVAENRTLVVMGLKKMRVDPCAGIKAICDVSSVNPKDLASYHMGFVIGPHINASGRLGSASMALELLSTEDYAEAYKLAKKLHDVNQERKSIQKQVEQEALEQAEDQIQSQGENLAALVLDSEKWHEGVIGIVASRVVEKYHRPVAIVSFMNDKEVGKSSLRSYQSVDVLAAIQQCDFLLEGFGGHKAAAGLSIRKENIEEFREAFAEAVAEQVYTIRGDTESNLLDRKLSIDVDVSEENLSIQDIEQLEILEPFGIGNASPVLKMRSLSVQDKRIMKEEHLKLMLQNKQKQNLEALWFFANEGMELTHGDQLNLAFTPKISEFRGHRKVELRIKDMEIG